MSLRAFLIEGGSRLSTQARLSGRRNTPPDPPSTGTLRAAGFDKDSIDYFVNKLKEKDEELPSARAMMREMVADFLGHGSLDSCIVRREWSHFWQPMLCMGFWQVQGHYDDIDWKRTHKWGEYLAGDFVPVYEDIEVGPDKKTHTKTTANLFLHTKCGKKVPMHVVANLQGNMWEAPNVAVECHRDHRKLAESFLAEIDSWVREANIYKDKLLTYQGGRGDGRLAFLSVPPCSWEDVILPPKLIKQIRRATVDMLKRRDTFYDVGLGVRRSVLLDGPPGVGKTQTNRALSNEVYASTETQATIIWVSAKAIESAQNIKGLYKAARICAPTLLLMEDVDLIGASRGSTRHDNYLLGELLTQMDGAEDNRGLITVATTNDLSAIDYALTKRPGRFDRVMKVPLPSVEARESMLKRFAASRKARFAKDVRDADEETGLTKWAQILEATEGMTGAYLQEIINTAVIEAINNDQVKNGKPILKASDILEAFDLVCESFNTSPRRLMDNSMPTDVQRRDFYDEKSTESAEFLEKAAAVRQRLVSALYATPAYESDPSPTPKPVTASAQRPFGLIDTVRQGARS